MASVSKLAFKGTIWTVCGYGTSQFLRLLGNIFLTRLLFPELFGLMALVRTFIMGLNLFSDVGINTSIIRHPNGERDDFLNTAWTIQIMRGVALWLCACLISWPVSQTYNEPRLLWLIPIVALNTFISGFNSTSLALLNRHMKLSRLTLFELGIQSISLLLLMSLAYLYRSIWALVIGNFITSLLRMLISHFLYKNVRQLRFAWNKEAVHEILTYGRWIFISTMMMFLATQADRLLLGKLLSVKFLGIYTVAITFSEIQRQVITQMQNKVLLPAISRRQDLPRELLRKKILPKRWNLLLLMILMTSLLWGFGDMLIAMLYDSRYQDAGWMLPILSLGLWPLVLHSSIDSALYAIGKPLYNAAGNSLKALYMFIVIPFVFQAFGFLGVIIAIAFNDLPTYITISFGLCREKLNFLVQDISATALLLCSVILISILRYSLGWGWPLTNISG